MGQNLFSFLATSRWNVTRKFSEDGWVTWQQVRSHGNQPESLTSAANNYRRAARGVGPISPCTARKMDVKRGYYLSAEYLIGRHMQMLGLKSNI